MKILATVTALVLLGGCGSSDEDSVRFSGTSRVAERKPEPTVKPIVKELDAEPVKIEKPQVVAEEVPARDTTEFFLSNSVQQQINMIWVVDNSGSMYDENEYVRQNLSDFASKVADNSNLNIALIGGSELSGIYYGDNKVNHLKTNVGSYDALQMVSAALCTEPDTGDNLSRKQICGRKMSKGRFQGNYVSNVRGKLDGFFQDYAKNIVVVVTDDDASGVDENNFLSLLAGQNIPTDLQVFGFIGKSFSRSCEKASRGSAYERLAEETGGKTYDICDDWGESFDDLTESVLKIERRPIKLERKPKKINWVKIDDKIINPRLYYLSRDNFLVIKGYDLEENAGDISVNYKW